MSEQHVDPDELVALALQQVEPQERARLSEHLEGCARCRDEYAGLEDAVQQTLAATPSIAPPAGFSGRVLATMGQGELSGATLPDARLGPRRWPWLVAAAAALVVGLALGIGGTLVVRTPPGPAGSVPGAATSASALITRSGETVGSAGTTVLSGRDYLVITVTRARPGAAYECILVGSDGQRHSAGDWTLEARAGATVAAGSWLVEAPSGDVARVELMTRSGGTWAQADF